MIRAGLLTLLLTSEISAVPVQPRLDPARQEVIRASIAVAANYAADVLLKEDGQSRGDYERFLSAYLKHHNIPAAEDCE